MLRFVISHRKLPLVMSHKQSPRLDNARCWLTSNLLFAAFWLCSLPIQAQNWPEFRGPTADGHSPVKRAPVTWSETQNIAWKTPIPGKGWSSPVIWEQQIWLTTAPLDGKSMSAVCLDLKSGKIVHDVKLWDVEKPQFCYDMNSYASPTPAAEAGRVYVHFGVHGTACIDTASGAVLWKRPPFDPELPCNHHRGPASSPILHRDRVILTFDGFDVQYLVALDKRTGKIIWKRDRKIDYGTTDGDAMKAYSTPRVIIVAGQEQLVSPSAGATVAYDPASGDELWRVRSGGMNASLRPLYANGLLYGTTAAGGFQLFAMKPVGTGDLTNTQVVWKQEKGAAKRSSPIVVGERIFMAGDDGMLTCVNALTGAFLWNKRVGGQFSASPVFAADKLYFPNMEGTTFVLEPAAEYKELAANKLDSGCFASPAVIEGALILRTKEAVYRITAGD